LSKKLETNRNALLDYICYKKHMESVKEFLPVLNLLVIIAIPLSIFSPNHILRLIYQKTLNLIFKKETLKN
jgi:FtsH-binding integral membrane protein